MKPLSALLGRGQRRDAKRSTLRLALECRGCRRTYRYDVETVYVDPEQIDADPVIQDRIQCRGCGRWDHYAFTPEAYADVVIEGIRLLTLLLSGNMTPRSPVTLVSSGLQDGRLMSPEEALRDYERRLAEDPDDPGLHVGHGNVLRFLKRFEAAAHSYRRALELDPHAVEAHSSLARLAAERGDVVEAARRVEGCLQALPHARFYRIGEDEREHFVEAVTADAKMFRQRAGLAGDRVTDDLRSAHHELDPGRKASGAIPPGGPPISGRNASCPCGSGKKYKKCCLPGQAADLVPAPAPRGTGGPAAADEELRQYLVEFAAGVPRREMDRAMAHFSEARAPSADTAEDTNPDAVAFWDWFINDYRLTTSGRTIIEEVLVTRAHELAPDALTLLASWRDAPVSLYEVVAVEPGVGMTLRELFGPGLIRIREVRGSRCVARWDVVATRLIGLDGAVRIAATVLLFRPDEKAWLLEEVERRLGAWRQGHPSAGVEQFLKAEGLLFHRLAREVARRRREEAENLTAVTAERHAVVLAKARYKMRDARRVLAALRSTEDFVESDPGPDARVAFVWLKLGASASLADASDEVPAGAIEFIQSFLATPEAEPVPRLGTVRLRGSRLVLECLSRERLGWGKARLADLLGDAALHEAEQFESLDAMRSSARHRSRVSGGEAGDPDANDEERRTIASRCLDDHYRRWIDQPLPGLDGLSPRQAARAPARGQALEELLRRIENLEDRRRMMGEASCDVSWVRRELGMGDGVVQETAR